jgi:hypothetical protein
MHQIIRAMKLSLISKMYASQRIIDSYPSEAVLERFETISRPSAADTEFHQILMYLRHDT